MDEEYVSLLQQLSLKKVELNELEREEKNWEARVSAIRQAEEVLSDRHRLEQVTVSLKLKKQIEDYIASEEEKKKKKVSDKQLMYEFMNKKVKDKDKEKQS
jgi:two-component sensor histidine kinase